MQHGFVVAAIAVVIYFAAGPMARLIARGYTVVVDAFQDMAPHSW
jgi:hypothetical protein